jgi:hypothetical protein
MNDRTGWLRQIVRPLILAAMVAVMGLAIVQLVQLFIPTWDGRYIAVLLGFLVIETHLSHRFLEQQELRSGERMRYRLAEAALLFFVVRFLPYLVPWGWERWGELQLWLTSPQFIILDAETWIVYIILIIFWQNIHNTLHDFAKIDGRVREDTPTYSLTAVYQDRVSLQVDAVENMYAHQALFNRFLQGGVILLLVTGLQQVGLQALTDFSRPTITGIFWTVGFYFVCGLMMIGVLRYAVMRRKWQVEYVTVDAGVARGWLGYLILLVGLGLGAALLMPTGYSLPLLGVVSDGISFLFSILAFIGLLVFLVITFPIVWVLWLISTLFGNEGTPPRFTPPAPPPMMAPMSEGTDWFALVQTAVLWVILLALLWFTIRTYTRDKSLPTRYPRLTAWWSRISEWWATIWAWFAHQQKRVGAFITHQWDSRRNAPRPRRGPRALVATNPVVNLYLRFLRRTQAQGIQRQVADTPYEYDHKLSDHYPEVAAEIDQLTAAFVEARYSRHPMSPEAVRESQAAWHRIKERLKRVEEEGKEE